MDSRVGLDYIVENKEYVSKLSAALSSPTITVKKQVFELLSALCVYSTDGYNRALDTLNHYMNQNGERYRLCIVVNELRTSNEVDYKTALIAFINCLVISAPKLTDRIRIRNEFIGLNLLPILSKLREDVSSHPDLGIQLDVFDEQRESDEAQGPNGINLNSHLDVFYAILKQVSETPQEIPFLTILQHLLKIDPKEPISDIIWDTAETLVHRATLLESREDAAKLLRAPSLQTKFGCSSCQHRDSVCSPVNGSRKASRALSPPPPPPPPPPLAPPPPPPPLLPPTRPLKIENETCTPAPPSPLDNIKLPQQSTPIPKTKMKTINWNKIPNNKVVGKKNIWSIVASSHKHSPMDDIDWTEMEGLFCQQVQPTNSAGSSPKLGRCTSAEERRPRRENNEITLLDGKRSLNVNIFLKQFRCSNEEIINLIRSGAHSLIGSERLRGLLKSLPELDETEMLRSYRGDINRLAYAEKFLMLLISLPNYKLRIESMLLKEEFASTTGYLESSINAILVAGDDLMSSQAIQEVLYIALIAGNFLNAGGYAGGAAGIKLSSLQKLTDIRANKPGMNLMHYVAAQAEKRNKELIHFAEDIRVLEDASKASVEQILNEINALDNKIATLKRDINLPTSDEDIRIQMDGFIAMAETEITALKRDMDEVESLRKTLAEFFCEDPVTFKIEDCFKIFVNFCVKFRAASADNQRRKLNEQQAAARRRARDLQNVSLNQKTGVGVSGSSVYSGSSNTLGENELIESLLFDIRDGVGRRSQRKRDGTTPDLTPDGSLRRRSRNSPCAESEVLEFLRASSAEPGSRDRGSLWGSLDRSWSRKGGPVRARLEIPTNERERAVSPQPQQNNNNSEDTVNKKPKEWRQKIESWLRANSQEEKQNEELRSRAMKLAHRRSLEHDSESEKSTLDTLPEHPTPATSLTMSHNKWKPSVLDKDVVNTIEIIEDVQPKVNDLSATKIDEIKQMSRVRRQKTRPLIEDIQNTLVEMTKQQTTVSPSIDADNIETPPMARRTFERPPDKEPCKKFQDEIFKENLGDGQFDRFSSTRRTRRYKRPTDQSGDESVTENPAKIEVVKSPRPSTLEVKSSYNPKIESMAKPLTEDREERLQRWRERLASRQAVLDEHDKSMILRRQTSINKEDVQKAIRELKSPTEHNRPIAKKSTPDLNDEGFEETNSLNSERSQDTSSAEQSDQDRIPKVPSTPPVPPPAKVKTDVRTPLVKQSQKRVERSSSRASLRSSRSSLNSSSSMATVRRVPTVPRAPVAPKAPPAPRVPPSRSSSSGSSGGVRPTSVSARGGFMRPTQASSGRNVKPTPAVRPPLHRTAFTVK